jgi:hypothetical protein
VSALTTLGWKCYLHQHRYTNAVSSMFEFQPDRVDIRRAMDQIRLHTDPSSYQREPVSRTHMHWNHQHL